MRKKTARKVELPNLKASPTSAPTIAGPKATVDRRSGRFHLMVSRSGWPRELGEAGIRFEADFAAAHGSIRGQSLEPRVDGGRLKASLPGLDATERLRRIQSAMDPEELAVFTLWAGLGVTISEISARGWGQKDEIGRVLQRAASKAAAIYHAGYKAPQSRRVIEMNKFINESTSIY